MLKEKCTICPRECGVNRKNESGFCRLGENARVVKAMLHQWEEPCICFGKGSGAVFFSGCQLQCAFCQNHEISFKICGKEFDDEELSDLFLRLQEHGACNVNLVSPTPHLFTVIPALKKAKEKGLHIPVVYNSGGYEKVETLQRLEGLVDIYLPDFKFFDSSLSKSLALAKDYSVVAEKAIREMLRQTGNPAFDGEHLIKGVLVRHLILPGHTKDSRFVIDVLSRLYEYKEFLLSLMWQYTPTENSKKFEGLGRRLTRLEYERVLGYAEKKGFSFIYTQEKSSADTAFIPDFSMNFLDK